MFFISCIAEWLFLCSKHKSVTRLGCDSFRVIVVDATSCNGTCGVFVRLSSQLGWIATEFSERLRICCSGPQPDRHRVENILELFAKAGRRLHNHIEHWTRNREASNVPSNPLAGELRARGSMGNARLSTRVGPQGFRVTRSFVPLGRFMTIKLSQSITLATKRCHHVMSFLIRLQTNIERKHYAQNRILLRIL